MSSLLIAYDLAAPHLNKEAIVARIMSLGEAWARPLDTVWYVRTGLDAERVTAELSSLLGCDDGLVVQAAEAPAGLANARLRWFRPRRHELRQDTGESAPAAANIVALPLERRQPASCVGAAGTLRLKAAS